MNLLFDFVADKETKTIYVTREFAAGIDLVWDAFTKAEILEKWVAPKSLKLSIKEMDFREGGRWLYAMVSGDNILGYSLAEFISINPKNSFTTRNSFADENGNSLNNQFSITTNNFKEEGWKTTVYIEKKFDDLVLLEKMATLGFKEGSAAGYANLDEYFLSITNNK